MFRKTILSACMFSALTWCHTASASAQRLDAPPTKDIYFTFSQPVTVPNMTLPAGKYLFRVVGDGRMIVQIFAGNGSKLFGTAMSARAMRRDQPEKPEIRLIESAANSPSAVGTWWYPENREGWEFIYPRDQAAKLAKTAKQSILTTATSTSANEMKSAELVRLEPSGQQSPYAESNVAPVAGVAVAGESSSARADANANRVAAAMSQDQSASRSARAESPRRNLPQTAGFTPLGALIGLLALSAAFGLRIWRQRLVG